MPGEQGSAVLVEHRPPRPRLEPVLGGVTRRPRDRVPQVRDQPLPRRPSRLFRHFSPSARGPPPVLPPSVPSPCVLPPSVPPPPVPPPPVPPPPVPPPPVPP